MKAGIIRASALFLGISWVALGCGTSQEPSDEVTENGAIAKAESALTNRFELVNAASGLRADVIWASTTPMQGVFLWPDNVSLSQEFETIDRGGGYFQLKARHSGQCLMLDWRAGTYSNGTPVIQYPFCDAGYAPSEWQIVYKLTECSAGDFSCFFPGPPVLVNRATGRCLDATNGRGGAPPAQAVLQQWDCITSNSDWNAGNQLWNLWSLDPPPMLH